MTATSLLLSPTAEVTAVWCGLELQLGFSRSLFFSFPTLLPSLRFVLHWRLLHGCYGSRCISPGAVAVDYFVIMGGAGGARKDGFVAYLSVAFVLPSPRRVATHATPLYHNQHLLCTLLTTAVVI